MHSIGLPRSSWGIGHLVTDRQVYGWTCDQQTKVKWEQTGLRGNNELYRAIALYRTSGQSEGQPPSVGLNLYK